MADMTVDVNLKQMMSSMKTSTSSIAAGVAIGQNIGDAIKPFFDGLMSTLDPIKDILNTIGKLVGQLVRPFVDVIFTLLIPILGILRPIVMFIRQVMQPFRVVAMKLSAMAAQAFASGDTQGGMGYMTASLLVITQPIFMLLTMAIGQVLKLGMQAEAKWLGFLMKIIPNTAFFIADVIAKGLDFLWSKIGDFLADIYNGISKTIRDVEYNIRYLLAIIAHTGSVEQGGYDTIAKGSTLGLSASVEQMQTDLNTSIDALTNSASQSIGAFFDNANNNILMNGLNKLQDTADAAGISVDVYSGFMQNKINTSVQTTSETVGNSIVNSIQQQGNKIQAKVQDIAQKIGSIYVGLPGSGGRMNVYQDKAGNQSFGAVGKSDIQTINGKQYRLSVGPVSRSPKT